MAGPSVEELGRELDGDGGPDVRVSPAVMARVRGQLRGQLVEQFHLVAAACRLSRKVGNEEMAQMQEGEAKKVLAMVAELDAESHSSEAQAFGGAPPRGHPSADARGTRALVHLSELGEG